MTESILSKMSHATSRIICWRCYGGQSDNIRRISRNPWTVNKDRRSCDRLSHRRWQITRIDRRISGTRRFYTRRLGQWRRRVRSFGRYWGRWRTRIVTIAQTVSNLFIFELLRPRPLLERRASHRDAWELTVSSSGAEDALKNSRGLSKPANNITAKITPIDNAKRGALEVNIFF